MRRLIFIAHILALSAFAAELPPLLNLPGTNGEAEKIDFAALPLLKGKHAIVCPYDEQWKFQLHNYLLHHEGKFWCMWSAGPEVEDHPTQHVRYATSDDGLHWSTPKNLTGMPAEGRAYIARGFWLRDGELLALAASYKGKGAFGVDKDLKLVAFAWDKASDTWTEKAIVFENAINNFSPQKLSTGEWMMTRRDARFNVSMLIGGMKSVSDWQVVPVVDRIAAVRTSKFSPDEPVWWEQPDGTLISAIRDNGGSQRLFHSVSTDHGRTWSPPQITNYPNATSKIFTLRTSRGFRVLASNANAKIGRREMHLALSDDGTTFTRLARLDIPSPKATTFQYPHVIEHDGSLLIAFSNKKNVTEVLKVSLDDIERLRTASNPPAKASSEPPVMLSGSWLPDNSHQLDFDNLPRVPSEHAVISEVRATGSLTTALDKKAGGVNQHNYLAHHDGKFWAMWSDGPGIEDRVGQRVKYATSSDGLNWSEPKYLTPIPPNSGPDSPRYNTRTDKGMRWISRGFWKRDNELLALASLDEAAGFFGPSLELRAFRFHKASEEWEDAGLVYKNTINNFPPLKLRTGDWMMSRRAYDYKTTGVHFLVGGVKALNAWESFPVLGTASELKAEEPDWWILPNNDLAAVFRDNRGSGFLYRAFSKDDGRTWSAPVKTNFPDATSKISGLRLGDGRYVLVSNPKPKRRDPLTLSISNDGLVFTKMLYLVGGRWIDYPHVIEHEGSLFIAFAGGKQSVEVLKVKLSDVDAVQMPEKPLIKP
jgi:predicted neuraminidase